MAETLNELAAEMRWPESPYDWAGVTRRLGRRIDPAATFQRPEKFSDWAASIARPDGFNNPTANSARPGMLNDLAANSARPSIRNDLAANCSRPEARTDQAEGLRRLLGRNAARVIALESAARGVGKTSVAINIAVALATRGMQVLLLDANSGAANISALLGLRPRFDLHDVLDGVCAIDDALLHGPAGVMVMPAGSALQHGQSARERERLDAYVMQFAPRFDYLLIDACAEANASAALRGLSAESIVVSPTGASAITATYALIKRVHVQRPQQRLHVLLNRVSSERNARLIFENLRRVAGVHLRATLECLGHVPRDAQMQRAAEGRQPVIEQFPTSAAAAGFHRIAGSIAAWSQATPAHARTTEVAPRVPVFPSFAIAHAGA
jgi:flagellar biosynthesis protein FlhG